MFRAVNPEALILLEKTAYLAKHGFAPEDLENFAAWDPKDILSERTLARLKNPGPFGKFINKDEKDEDVRRIEADEALDDASHDHDVVIEKMDAERKKAEKTERKVVKLKEELEIAKLAFRELKRELESPRRTCDDPRIEGMRKSDRMARANSPSRRSPSRSEF